MQKIPIPLITAIERGSCVAFVGAGFSAAAGLPGWGTLLVDVTDDLDLPEDIRRHVLARVGHGTAHALDEAAQVLQDVAGRDALVDALRARLATPALTSGMENRLRWLRGIPFQSILTTNFDGLLAGSAPGSDAYREALRPELRPWWSKDYWTGHDGAPTLELHGDVAIDGPEAIVLTRRDYRRRLYEDPAYQSFLRSLFATRTILYMGFSFQDAYLNELRSETLALIGQRADSDPVSFAIANDVPPTTREHFRRNEGIEILSYDSGPGHDHRGFDAHLEAIYVQTNPLQKFGRNLSGKRILWVDPHPQNNEEAFTYLDRAARLALDERGIDTVESADAALDALRSASSQPYDLVISHWGEERARDDSGERVPAAIRLLAGIRRDDVRTPVVLFAANTDADARKREALGLGAQAYCYEFDTLYREIDRILAPGSETG